MPYDAVYEDLFSAYLDVCERYEKAVANLMALYKEGNHKSLTRTGVRTRDLAVQVEAAHNRAAAHRRLPLT